MFTEAAAVVVPIARTAIARSLGLQAHADEAAGFLQEVGACFVTLMQGRELRGCMGTIEAHRALLEDLKSNALAAAFRDPRFTPLKRDELALTRIEISLLSPSEPLTFADEGDAIAQLRPFVDGLVFQYRDRRSTFLPQVWESLPDRTKFMTQLKRKAGFAPDFWADEVRLSRYAVTKFAEGSDSSAISPAACQLGRLDKAHLPDSGRASVKRGLM